MAKNALDAEKKKAEEDVAASGKPAWEKKADADKILATYTLLTRFTPNYDKLVKWVLLSLLLDAILVLWKHFYKTYLTINSVTLKGFENLANQLHLTYQLGYGEHNAPVTIVSTTTANPAEQEVRHSVLTVYLLVTILTCVLQWQLIPVNNKFRIIADKPQGALSYIALSEDLERVFASHTWSQPNQLAEQPDSLWEVRLDSGSNILQVFDSFWHVISYNQLIVFGFQRLVVPNTGLVVTRDSKTAYVSIVRLSPLM